jgi:hypothetical protein
LPTIELRHSTFDLTAGQVFIDAAEISVAIQRQPCRRTAEGVPTEWVAVLSYAGDVYEGCASIVAGSAEAAVQPDFSAGILEHFDIAKACLGLVEQDGRVGAVRAVFPAPESDFASTDEKTAKVHMISTDGEGRLTWCDGRDHRPVSKEDLSEVVQLGPYAFVPASAIEPALPETNAGAMGEVSDPAVETASGGLAEAPVDPAATSEAQPKIKAGYPCAGAVLESLSQERSAPLGYIVGWTC